MGHAPDEADEAGGGLALAALALVDGELLEGGGVGVRRVVAVADTLEERVSHRKGNVGLQSS